VVRKLMNEIVVISGKGGTGKTSLAACFAVLAGRCVVADCDVDAADMHLLLLPQVRERHEFRSGREAAIRCSACTQCGLCVEHCRYGSILRDPATGLFAVDGFSCEGCGVCALVCPALAVQFCERTCGEWMVSETRCGPMVHAQLGVAAENSGKLVSTVRQAARRIAEEQDSSLILVDGPPGIGCPVIASITGASRAVVVTEPTVSGRHDLERVLALTGHFGLPAAICVNKWDLNEEMTGEIERGARAAGACVVGRIRYDPAVTLAQTQAQTAVETGCAVAEEIRQVWNELLRL
jgi:MinD superfamily P-loop ATPase